MYHQRTVCLLSANSVSYMHRSWGSTDERAMIPAEFRKTQAVLPVIAVAVAGKVAVGAV